MSFAHALDALRPVLVVGALKAAIPFAGAWGITALMRQASAAARHAVWLLAVALAVALPLFSVTLPRWTVPVLPMHAVAIVPTTPVAVPAARRPVPVDPAIPATVAPSIVADPAVPPSTPRPPVAPASPVRFGDVALIVWLIIAITIVALEMVSWIALWQLGRRATPVFVGPVAEEVRGASAQLSVRRRVTALISPAAAMPMTWGILRPRVLFPADAATWPADRLRAVALHELAHVKRWDCATQSLARVACAIYWFNPLAWLAARRLRIERELACDDIVLAAGTQPATYAEELLSLARPVRAPGLARFGGLRMARPAGLKGRLIAILDANRNRAAVGRKAALIALAIALTVMVPLATLRIGARRNVALAQTAPATRATTMPAMAFHIRDADAKPLPGVTVQINCDGAKSKGITNADGELSVPLPASPRAYLNVSPRAEGFVKKEVSWSPDDRDRPPASYEMRLERGVTIGGKVVDDAGVPVVGANVALWVGKRPKGRPHERYFDMTGATTVADGAWTFDHAPADGGFEAGAWDYRYANGESYAMNRYSIADLAARKVTLTLKRGLAIEGMAVDPDGKPLAGVTIAYGSRAVSASLPAQITEADGRFTYAATPGEHVTLIFSAKGFAMDLKQFVMGDAPQKLTVPMARSKPLVGRVVGPDGKGVAGASLSVSQWRGIHILCPSVQTGADGRFEWKDGPADALQCNVSGRNLITEIRVDLKPNEENLIKMRPPVHVTAIVLDDATGVPIDRFTLVRGIWWGRDGTILWQRENARTEAFGGKVDYVESVSYPGYAALIEAPGYEPAPSRVIMPEEANASVTLRLKHGQGSIVTIKRPDGTPAAGAQVVIAGAGHGVQMQNGESFDERQGAVAGKTDATGRFSFFPAKESYVLVAFSADGYAEADNDALAKSAEVALQPWGHAHLRLKIGSRVGAHETVSLSPLTETPNVYHVIGGQTDAGGRVQFDRVPPGRYFIGRTVEHPLPSGAFRNDYSETTRAEVKAGETVELTLGGTGRPVTGKIVIPAALAARQDWTFGECELNTRVPPPPAIKVPPEASGPSFEANRKWWKAFEQTDEGKRYTAAVEKRVTYPLVMKQDGSFRAEDVPSGSYDLTVTLLGQQTSRLDLSEHAVAAGSATVEVPEIPGGRSDEPLLLPPVTVK